MALHYPVLQIAATNTVPFEMHTMEWIDQNRWQQNATPHRHNYFVIVWVKKGSGTHLVDLEQYDITDNTIYCLTPGQVHLLKADEHTDGYVISFSTDFLCLTGENFDLVFNSGLFYTGTTAPVIHVTPEMEEDLQNIVSQMKKEYENYFLLRSEILRGYLRIFLIHLSRESEKSPQSAHHPRNLEMVRQFFTLLEKNFASKKMVTDYASELAVTPNYLNEIIKKSSGLPASEHIKQRVILEAKRHAVYSDVSMKEIAYQLGFDNVAHFSKYFKNASGMNFTDWKKDAPVHFAG